MDMKEKIEFLLRNKGLTSTQLARLLVIQPSGISHILSGRNKPSFDFVVKILRAFPDVNPDWLLLGSDKVFRDDAAAEVSSSNLHPASDGTLFDEHENSKISEPLTEQKNDDSFIFQNLTGGGKTIERVIVLYTDHSFDSYSRR